MKAYLGKKKINLDVRRVKLPWISTGLMFRTNMTRNLLFEFSSPLRMPITSLFVFFSFLVVWLDERNRVVDYKVVKPFSFSVNSRKKFIKFVEIPINRKNSGILRFFVGKQRKI